MQHIVLGLTVVIATVCLALSYAWYHSEGAADRRLQRRLQQEHLAAHRRELLERTLAASSSDASREAADET